MKFEDLDVWKRVSRLSVDIYKNQAGLNDYGFRDQLTRASLSTPSNIVEGFERESVKEFLKFLSYIKGSCAEVRTQIYIGIEIGYIGKKIGKDWIQETIEISSMLAGLIKTKRKQIREP